MRKLRRDRSQEIEMSEVIIIHQVSAKDPDRWLKEMAEIMKMNELNSLDSEITSIITNIEVKLRGRFSVRLRIDIGDNRTFSFGKWDGLWQLYVTGENDEVCPAKSLPRDQRHQVFGWVRKLIEDAPGQIERMIDERRSACADGMSLLKSFEIDSTDSTEK